MSQYKPPLFPASNSIRRVKQGLGWFLCAILFVFQTRQMLVQITVQTNKRQKAGRSRVQQRFDRLRSRIEREERKNAKLSRELDELARWLEIQFRQIECDVLDASCRLEARLIEFFKRKSLSNWHREELVEWISEMGEQVSAIDPQTGAELHQQFVEALGKHFDMSDDEMQRQFRDHFDAENVEFEIDDDDEFDDDVQPDLFGEADDTVSSSGWQTGDDGASEAGSSDAASGRAGRLADADWLRGLFRRAAQALHPDRETDPELRAHKQERVQQLLNARRQGDVLAILEIYAEASGDKDLALAEKEMQQACDLMEQRLERLQCERMTITQQSPLHALAHDEFFSVKRKTREQKLKRWKKEAQTETRRLSRIVNELKNLDVLKAHLRTRREEKFESLQALRVFFDDPFY